MCTLERKVTPPLQASSLHLTSASQDLSKDFFCSLNPSQCTSNNDHHLRKKLEASTLANFPPKLVNDANHAVLALELKIYLLHATLKDLLVTCNSQRSPSPHLCSRCIHCSTATQFGSGEGMSREVVRLSITTCNISVMYIHNLSMSMSDLRLIPM